MPLEIEGRGWELLVTRVTLQHRHSDRRTYGRYEVFLDGAPVRGLSGHICESPGPGDNTARGKHDHLRIEEGRYPLSTQFGDLYRSIGFTNTTAHPLPGFLLLGTEVRTGILVHPAHPPKLYLSSIGCLNPTAPVTADKDMDFTDSRRRVIAMIDSLKEHDPGAFARDKIGHNTRIARSSAVITGEPMTEEPDLIA